ncbi:MAG: hypothetical protein IJ956_06835, partial [Akkermansia sp.]|nr:hypothetical protein [Akkermansia sp.]
MKLHLPKLLRNAVLACMAAVVGISTSAQGGEVISINFGSNQKAINGTDFPDESATLNGVTGAHWNNIADNQTGANAADIALVNSSGVAAGVLSVSGKGSSWSSGSFSAADRNTLENAMLQGYLDLDTEGQYVIDSTVDHISTDLFLYFSGDKTGESEQYSPINVDGITYIGGEGDDNDEAGKSEAWGDRTRTASQSLSDKNSIVLRDVDGISHIFNVADVPNAGRSTIAGMQIVLNDLNAHTITSSANVSALTCTTGYLDITAEGTGCTLNYDSGSLKGVQLSSGNLTLTAATGTKFDVARLWAKEGTTLTVDAELADRSVVLGGLGSITLNQNQTVQDFTVQGDLHIANGVSVVVQSSYNHLGGTLTAGTGASLYMNVAAGADGAVAGVTLNLNQTWASDLLSTEYLGVMVGTDAAGSLAFDGAGSVKFVKAPSASGDVTISLNSISAGTTAGAQSISVGDGVTVAGTFDGQLKLEHNQVFTVGEGVSLSFKQAEDSTGGRAIVLGNGTLNIDGGSITAESLCLADGASGRQSNLAITNGGYLEITSTDNDDGKHGGICLSHWQYSTTNVLIEEGEFRALDAKVNMVYTATAANLTIGAAGVMNTKGLRMDGAANVSVSGMLNLGTIGIENPSGSLTINGGTLGALSAEGWSGAQDITIAGGSTVQLAVYDVNTKTYSGSADIALNGVTNLSGSIALSGGGTLSLSNAALSAATTFTGEAELALSGRQSIAYNLTHTTGVTRLEDFEYSGEGALTLGAAVITGELKMMNSKGGAISMQSFTAGEGATLAYGTEGQLAQLGSIGGAVSLNLYGVGSKLAEGVDLGFTRGTKTLDEIKAMLTVIDLSDYTLSEGANGNVFLTSSATLPTDWDYNWGAFLAHAPKLGAGKTFEDSDYGTFKTYNVVSLSGSSCDVDGVISVKLEQNSKENTVVLGGILDSAEKEALGETLNKEVWIKATGGTYSLIAGGSWNAWYRENNTKYGHILNGDTHIVVDRANVANIVGGQFQDDQTAVHNGDTYISVYTDTVKGFIVGSGVTHHNSSVTQTGNTNIYIYSPLASDVSQIIPDHDCLANTNYSLVAVVGGSVKAANAAQSSATLNGNTNITIDIASAAEGAQFTKAVIGGHYDAWNPFVQTLRGNTNVTIDAEGVAFTENVIAGSLTGGKKASSISGSTNLTIEGGTFTAAGKGVYGGSFVMAYDGAMTVGATNVEIKGGTIANLVGGSNYGGTTETEANGSIGNISVSVSGGEVQSLIGGSRIERNKAESTIAQGGIVVDLIGGTVGDVYAAGEQVNASKLTAASTQVTIGAGVTIADGKTISGGYKLAEGMSGSTVTGDSTLVLSAAQNRSGVNFKDFNKITASANATIGSISNTAAVTKNGTGILTLGAATNSLAGGLTVSEGGLATAAVTTLGGALTMSDGTSLNLSSGALTLVAGDSGAALSLTNVALTTGTLDETSTLISGISALTGYTSGEVAASTFFSSINNITNLSSYKVKVENGSLILLHSSAPLYWEGGDGNWNSSGWAETDGATTGLGAFVSGADVTFSNTASTITVNTNASVGIMTVSGAAYTFNRTESNTITASGLVIGENASATFGAGALDLAALESLSIAAGGVLDLTAMDGVTVFNETTNMAEGAGTIKLTAGSQWMLAGGSEAEPKHFSIDVNYEFSGDTTMNSGSYTHSVLDIKGDMDIDGVFLLENRITADVMGGNLKATEIKLGHGTAGYAGHLKMSAGTITAGAITVSNAATTTNTFTMQGGTLELTGTAGIAATIDTQITGGKLKTGDNSWSITGAEIGGSTAGAVTIETGTGTIELVNATLTST